MTNTTLLIGGTGKTGRRVARRQRERGISPHEYRRRPADTTVPTKIREEVSPRVVRLAPEAL
jgi:hypothetical protein